MPNASPRPGLLVGLIRARARCSPRGTSFGRSVQPRPPNSGGEGGPTYLRGGGFLLSRKCLSAPSSPTPLNGYTFMLFLRHPCRHGRSSILLQAIHMHHSERLVSFPACPSPVIRQEKQLPMRTHIPETEESESDTSGGPGDRPGPKEDSPHVMARPPSDLEGDREGAEPDQEEVRGAEPSPHLELAILNGLDISSLPALRDLSTGASTTVHILWPPARMERATPEWRQRASQAMAFLLGGRSGEHYSSWSDALRQRPECRLDPPDTTTQRGIWTARMHSSTVCRVLDGLVSGNIKLESWYGFTT